MNLPDDPPSSDPPRKAGDTLAKTRGSKGRRAAPETTALRRRRLQMVRYLRIIACLRDEASELRAEIASLESIIGAQADAIDALRRRPPDPGE